MRTPALHFVGISPAIQSAVEVAYDLAIARFPLVDSAIIAVKAEQLARYMEENKASYTSIRRYARSAMLRKVRDTLKTKVLREIPIGLLAELEDCATQVRNSFQREVDYSILLEQVRTQLSERDRHILYLLRNENTTAEIAQKLGLEPAAARKAIQRARERIAHCLAAAKPQEDKARKLSVQSAPHTVDLTKEWT